MVRTAPVSDRLAPGDGMSPEDWRAKQAPLTASEPFLNARALLLALGRGRFLQSRQALLGHLGLGGLRVVLHHLLVGEPGGLRVLEPGEAVSAADVGQRDRLRLAEVLDQLPVLRERVRAVVLAVV